MLRVNKKRLSVAIGICLILIALSELILRYVFGFCDAVLYQSSTAYEYIAQPNQHRYRFLSHIDYNSYSQRSEEPDSTKTIVLGLGDSVIFGGTMHFLRGKSLPCGESRVSAAMLRTPCAF